ncbi:MAG: polysaccharide biosynthesis/export family protein [Verrucomicrobiota bacterium]
MNVRAKQLIEKVGGNLVGIVLNNINMSQDESYYYYSGYYHDYYAKNEDSEPSDEKVADDKSKPEIKQKVLIGLSAMKRSMKNTILKMTERVAPWLGLVLLSGLLGAGCQTQDQSVKFSPVPGIEPVSATNVVGTAPVTAPESGGPFGLHSDRFAIGDLVRVIFSGTIEAIQPHEERIKDDGTITLPLIGTVKADGMTPGELQKAITSAYVPDYYKRLTVTVTSSQRVYYVGGQVRQPGPSGISRHDDRDQGDPVRGRFHRLCGSPERIAHARGRQEVHRELPQGGERSRVGPGGLSG